MEEEKPNVGRMSAFGVDCQLVHQLTNDNSPIHHFFLGVRKKQGGGKGKSGVIGLLRAQNGYLKANIIFSLSSLQYFTK